MKREEFMHLYRPVHPGFERFCRARVYGLMDHGDLMNETLLIAYQKFDTIKKKTSFLYFLIGIAIRVLANINRKKKPLNTIDDLHENQLDSGDNTDSRLEVKILYEALAKLPEAQKESIILFEISGYSIKEIAIIHNVGESAVKQRLRQGRQMLTKILVDEPKKEQKR